MQNWDLNSKVYLFLKDLFYVYMCVECVIVCVYMCVWVSMESRRGLELIQIA